MKNFFDKGFRVTNVEQPENGYGLCSIILVARDGESWKLKASTAYIPPIGTDVRIRLNGTRNTRDFSSHGFELPEPLPRMPKQAIRAIYAKVSY